MTGYRRARRDLLFFVAFFLLALVLTLPLVLQFPTHVAGDGSDDPALTWNLWWVPHALIDLGSNPIYTDHLFYPIGLNLAFYTLTYLNAFLSVPIQYVLGIVPAANVNLWLSFALSGFGAFLLARHLLMQSRETEEVDNGIDLAAFAAGIVYAFSSNKFLYASLGQFNIASSQWIPFYLLYLVKLLPPHAAPMAAEEEPLSRRRLLRYGFMLGVFLLLQAASELIFASFLVLFTLAYVLYWFLANRRGLRQWRDRLIALGVASLVFLIPLSPVLAAMAADLRTEGDFIQSGLGFSNSFSADLLGFFVPSRLHPLLGGLDSQFHFAYINFVYLGFAAIALALIALARVPRARIWGLWLGLTFLITLGPTLRVNGNEYDLPLLPFNLLLQIPIVKGNRYPSRWSVLLTLFLAVLVAYGLYWILKRVRSREPARGNLQPQYLVTAAVCLLILFEHLSAVPTTDIRIPPEYATIAQDLGDYAVMELPLTWRNGFRVTGSYRAGSQGPIDREFMLAQWYQSAHGHPILNGNTSRNPEFKFQYFAEAPVLDSLIAIQTGHTVDEATRTRDRALAPRVLQFFGIRYIVWHTPYEEANRDVAARTRAYIEQVFPVSKVAETYENGKGTALYRVADAPAVDSFTIRPDDPLARLEFGDGWSAVGQGQIRLEKEGAQAFFPLAQPRDLRITIPFPAGSTGAAGTMLTVNGHVLTAEASESGGALVRDVPAAYLRSGVNEVTFQNLDFVEIVPPDLSSIRFPIGSTGGSSPAQIVVRSAGEEQGDFGHIYVRGIDESPGGTGYNVVVIDPNSGKVEQRANFNTFGSEAESARLAQFIDAVPAGWVVAAAVRDEASTHLTQEAVAALRSIGAAEDLRGKFRWSHAVIGVKGAAPGTALEAASETTVSQLIVGIGATSPAYGPEITEIQIAAR